MKLLVIRDQHEFVTHLREQIDSRIEAITPVPVAWDAIGDSVDISRLIEQQKPDYIICAVFLPANSGKSVYKRFRTVVEQIERCSRKHALPFIFLSTGAVYDGSRPFFSEEDECSANTEIGKFYVGLETHIARKIHKHLILRTTWLFCAQSENFLTSVIAYAAGNSLISLNSAGKGCPTAMQDLARVVIAILLQLDAGADQWGIYHYASSDPAMGYQFAEAIVANASQYNKAIEPTRLNFEHDSAANGRFYFEPVVLKCRKLLDTFGIQQRSWRTVLAATVRQYFELEEVENEQ